jgi:ribulose 1,5-bisphosphate synthetase/thiazole synthase
MASLSGNPISYWVDSTSTNNFSSLENHVAIVGAGIAGITAATLLKKAGKTVAVLESREVGTGATGHTTAKVTSLHQLIYATLILRPRIVLCQNLSKKFVSHCRTH